VSVYGDSNSTTVGGGAFGAVKVIAFNKVLGMEIIRDDIDAPTGNCFLNNSIFSKAGLVIDLGNNGVMPNEPRNRDTGFINQQNFPILSSATTSEGSTTVKGSLNRAPPVRAFSSSFLHSFWPTGQDPHWPEKRKDRRQGQRLVAGWETVQPGPNRAGAIICCASCHRSPRIDSYDPTSRS
jgi:hypothetical protein